MEEWKDVFGYEEYYQVSNLGQIKSKDRLIKKSNGVVQFRRGRLCSQALDKDGYAVVKLSKDGKTKSIKVHRIVYCAFKGKIPNGHEINHINFNRLDNRVDNLEALTHRENVERTVRAGRHFTARGLTGEANPNYGNTKLHRLYLSNKALSAAKQGRRGAQNGRSKKVKAVFTDGTEETFDCLKDCAKYIIDREHLDVDISYLSTTIRQKAQQHQSYNNIYFNLI